MKKIMLFILVITVPGLFYGWKYFSMTFADTADYTEQDTRKYEFYTPDILKHLPRISHIYRFHYRSVSGPNPALIYQITFSNVTDTSKINHYLEQKNYQKIDICYTAGECWQGKDPNITISVLRKEQPDSVQVGILNEVQVD